MQNGRSISKRGVSCQFGPDVTERFLEQNKLDFIVRSHEVKAEGYEVTHSGKCITVFSAPNYWYVLMLDNLRVLSQLILFILTVCCILPFPSDQMGNKGAYIHLRGSDLKPEFHQFTAVVSLLYSKFFYSHYKCHHFIIFVIMAIDFGNNLLKRFSVQILNMQLALYIMLLWHLLWPQM